MKRVYTVNSDREQKELAMRIGNAKFTRPYLVTADFSDNRTLDQNSLMWAMLTEISRQKEWDGHKMPPDDWKTLFTAHLRGQKPVSGIEGGLVFLGKGTSRMSKTELTELIDFMEWWGTENGVEFREAG